MQVSAGAPDAKQCTVAVPRTRSLRCRAPSTLTLVARDAEGNTCTKGGARVEVTAKAVGSVQPGQVVDNANGTYALNLELDVEGDWEITAMVRDQNVFFEDIVTFCLFLKRISRQRTCVAVLQSCFDREVVRQRNMVVWTVPQLFSYCFLGTAALYAITACLFPVLVIVVMPPSCPPNCSPHQLKRLLCGLQT